MRGDFDDNDNDDFLSTKYTKSTEIVRADGSLIEDVAGNVVSQRFRRLQMNPT